MKSFRADKEHRIWSAATQKCLVLKKDGDSVNVTFAGDGKEDGTSKKVSSKVIATEKDGANLKYIAWYLEFGLDGKKYVLRVENDNVTAKEFTEGNLPGDAAVFVPDPVAGPFIALKLESNPKKRVDIEDTRLTIKESKDAQPCTTIFVICDANE